MNPRTTPPPDFNISINKEILSSKSSACRFVRRQTCRNSSAKSFLCPYCYLSPWYGQLDLRRVPTVLCCVYDGLIACDSQPASPPSLSPPSPLLLQGAILLTLSLQAVSMRTETSVSSTKTLMSAPSASLITFRSSQSIYGSGPDGYYLSSP